MKFIVKYDIYIKKQVRMVNVNNKEVDYDKVFKNMLNAQEQLENSINNSQDIPYEEQTDIYMKYIQSHSVKTLGGIKDEKR